MSVPVSRLSWTVAAVVIRQASGVLLLDLLVSLVPERPHRGRVVLARAALALLGLLLLLALGLGGLTVRLLRLAVVLLLLALGLEGLAVGLGGLLGALTSCTLGIECVRM